VRAYSSPFMPAPTHTAIGTWSGGRFMHFGEPLDDERLLAVLRPDEAIRTVLTADVYGAGEAPYSTSPEDVIGWLRDHYREHVQQCPELVASWREGK